jgi:fibronectin-binding autotransporter adhesin
MFQRTKAFFRRLFTRTSPAATRQRQAMKRRRVFLEGLESRSMLAVLFDQATYGEGRTPVVTVNALSPNTLYYLRTASPNDASWSATSNASGVISTTIPAPIDAPQKFNFIVSTTPGGASLQSREVEVPVIQLTVTANPSPSEGSPTTIAFAYISGGPTSVPVTFSIGGSATAGIDYTALSAIGTLPPGSSVTRSFSTFTDNLVEGTETIDIALTNTHHYYVSTSGPVTNGVRISIIDRPVSVSVNSTDNTASEYGPNQGAFTFTRSPDGNHTQPLTVNYTVSGTAANGTDYVSLPGSITIPGNSLSSTLPLIPVLDGTSEGNENVVVTVTGTSQYVVGTPVATVTISDDPATSVVLDGLGNLIITDEVPLGLANNINISRSGTNLVLTNDVHPFSIAPIAGAVLSNGDKTLSIPFANVTGNITVTVDLAGGDAIPAGGLIFNGGENAGDDDQLKITGYSLTTADGVADVSVTHTGAEAGNVVLAGLGTVTFAQIEPLSLVGDAADIEITLPAGADSITLGDDGGAQDGNGNTANTSALYDATGPAYSFELTEFTNPTNSLTIKRGSAADDLNVLDLVASGMNASLKLGEVAGEFDQITFSGPVTLTSNKNLTANASGTISLTTATSDLATSGTGAISLTTARDIAIVSGSSITTVNGNLSLLANQQGSPTTGDFAGISVTGGLIQATGVGSVTVRGKGGNASTGSQYGVQVLSGGDILGGTGGLLFVEGTGGASTGSNNRGILLDGAGTTINSAGANVQVNGVGGGTGGTSAGNFGALVFNGAAISAGGAGTVDVSGFGGVGASASSHGTVVQGTNSIITSTGGNVEVSGQGLSTAFGSRGVSVVGGGKITAGGTGSVTVDGMGGGTYSSGVEVNSASFVTSSGGNVQVTGTGGSAVAGESQHGVLISSDGHITSGGTGTVVIIGVAGAGTALDPSHGVFVDGNTSTIGPAAGNITITGTGAIAANSLGIRLRSGASISTSGTGNATLIADRIFIDTGATPAGINVGSNTATLRTKTPVTVGINLGSMIDTTANTLEISDAELDRVTAGTLQIGDANSGAITFTANIDRAASTNVVLTTGANNNIALGAFSLNAGPAGDIALTTSGTGGITTSNNTGIDLTGDDIVLTAGSGGIGSGTNLVRMNANTISAIATGGYHLSEADTVTIAAGGLDGNADNDLAGGTFVLGGAGRIEDNDIIGLSGTLKLNGFNETLRGISSGAGAVIQNDSATHATLTINDDGFGYTLAATLGGATANENNFSIHKIGNGSMNLNGNNTFTGAFTIDDGSVRLGHGNALGSTSGTTIVQATGALDINGQSVSEPLSLSGLGFGPGALYNNSGTAGLVNASVTLTGNTRMGGTGDFTISGIIDDGVSTFGLTKEGAGIVTLFASNSFNGDVIVNAGELRITGSTSATSDVTAQTGGTVGGTGTINDILSGGSNGKIAPGSGGVGTLTVNRVGLQAVTMVATSSLNIEIGGASSYDILAATGAVSVGGSTLNLSSFGGFTPVAGNQYVFLTNDSTDAIVGTFVAGTGSTLTAGTSLPEGTVVSTNFLGSGLPAIITYTAGTGNDVGILVGNTTVALSSGNLTIADAAAKSDDIRLKKVNVSGTDYLEIYDPVNYPAGAGFIQVDAHTVRVPWASITGSITVNSLAGNDKLTVDFSGVGSPITSGGISYDGGAQTTQDVLALVGGTTTTVQHNFVTENSGIVVLTGALAGTITYAGIEPITDNVSATNRIFSFTSASAETIALTTSPLVGFDNRIDSNVGGELVDFTNPTASLEIITTSGSGADVVTISSISSTYRAATTITTGGDDAVNVNAALTLGSGAVTGSFSVAAAQLTTLTASINTDAGTNAGAISISSPTRLGANVTLDSDGSGTDGGITLGGLVSASASDTHTLTMVAGGGNVSVGSFESTAANRLLGWTVSSANNVSSGGVTTGSGGVNITGAGTAAFSASITTVGGGPIAINSPTISVTNNLTTTGAGHITFTHSGALTVGGTVALGASATLTDNNTGTGTINGVISGGLAASSVVKNGTGTLTLGGANSYSGATTLSGGILSVSSLANGGSNSNLGASSNAAANLVFNGGTLLYTGAAGSTDRLFTLTENGGTIDSSGTGNLQLTNTGSIAFTGSGARTLTLTGSNQGTVATSGDVTVTALNRFLPIIGNGSGGNVSVQKSGVGVWSLGGSNSYAGSTNIAAGQLGITASTSLGTSAVSVSAGAQLAFSATGLTVANAIALNGLTTFNFAGRSLSGALVGGNISGAVNNTLSGPLTLNATSNISTNWNDKTLTITGKISGAGGLQLDLMQSGNGAPNLTLSNATNDYAGGTFINSGILRFSADGNLGAATGSVTFNGGQLIDTATTGVITMSRPIVVSSGGGTITTSGTGAAGSLVLSAANQISGSAALSKSGGSDLQIMQNNAFAGVWNVVSGNLVVSSANALGTTAGVTNVFGSLVLNSGSSITVAENLALLNTTGDSLVNAAGANTVTGTLSVPFTSNVGFRSDAGTLNINSNLALPASAIAVSGAGNTVINGQISGGGSSVNYPTTMSSTANLLDYWRFNETSGTTVASTGSGLHNGTLVGGPTLNAASQNAQLGTAIQFNGSSQYITTAAANTMGLNGSFTAMAWVNANNLSGDRTIFGTDAASANTGLHLIIRGGKPHFGFYSNDTGGNATLSTGTWYHLVWRFDSGTGTQSMFVNGVLDSSTAGHAAFAGTGVVNIGRWNSGNYFSGSMDEPAIFNRALSNAEVLGIATAGFPTSVTKSGSGTLTLTANNSYSGQTTVSGGTLQVGAAGTTGTLGAGAVVNNGALTINRSNAYALSNGVTGSGVINQIGAGTTTLTNTNSAAGGTNVTGGILAVNGTLTSNVVVTAPATLWGSGTITGNVSGNGTFSPGNSPGTMTIIGAFNPSGTVNLEVNSPWTTPGTDFDRYNVTGSVNLTGATLNFPNAIDTSAPSTFQMLTLINNDGTADLTTAAAGPVDGALVTIGSRTFRLFYNGGDGNDVVLVEATQPTVVYVEDTAWSSLTPGTNIPDGDFTTGTAEPAIYGVNAFNTIQAAINAVAGSGTVIVNAGTYAENVVVNKSVILIGAQDGIDARGRVATESTIQSPNGGLALDLAANAITVNGFRVVDGVLRANGNNLSIVNNLFDVNGSVLNPALVGTQTSVIGLGTVGGTVTVSQNSLAVSGTVGADNYVLGPLDGQEGWTGGAQPNFTNNDLGFDNLDGTFGDEAVTNLQSQSGAQSWRYSRGYGSPGQGTPFTPNLGATVGAPSFADGDTSTVTFGFRAVDPAGDGSSQNIYEGDVGGNERTGAQINLQNLASGVRLFTNIYNPTTNAFSVVELGVYSGSAWHTVEMITVYNDDPALDLTTFKVDGLTVAATNPWMHIWRADQAGPPAYVPGSRLKFFSLQDGSAAIKGFYYDNISMEISDTSNPGVPIASYSTSFETLTADVDSVDGVKLTGNAGGLTALNITNNNVDGGNTDTAASSGVRVAATTAAGNVTISGNDLTGFNTGVFVAAANTANISGNIGSINGNVIGIDVNGGSASITSNSIYDNGTGIRVTNGGTVTALSDINFFDGSATDPDNNRDLQLTSTAGAVTFGNNLAFRGNTFFIDNQDTPAINLTALTGITFDEVNNFRIEDKMHHLVDTDLPLTTGLITWVASNVYVTSAGTDHSIQRGVDAASSGHTVNVEAGTYAENVVLNKQLTLLGAQQNVDARGRVVASPNPLVESIIAPVSGRPIELQSLADNLTINGFAVVGSFSGAFGLIESTSGPLDNFNLLNNHVAVATGFTAAVLFLNDSAIDADIDRNEFVAATGSAQAVFFDSPDLFHGLHFTNNNVLRAGAPAGTGLFVDGNRNIGTSISLRSPIVSGNLFQNHALGFNAGQRSFDDTQFVENTFTLNTGGFAGGPLDSTIARNTFSSNSLYGVRLTAFGNTADPTRGAQNTTVSNNIFTGNGTTVDLVNGYGDIRIDDQFNGTQSTNTIINNSLGSTIGAFNRETNAELINFSGNWWGTNTNPETAGKILGQGGAEANVDYTPWLNSGTDASGTAGFQGDFSNLHVDDDSPQVGATGRISEGINLLTATGTVQVKAGTYVENVSTTGKTVTVAPGTPASQVLLTGNLTLDSNDTLALNIDGLSAATQYDNFVVTGTVALGSATLAVTASITPAALDTFTLINNDAADAVSGIFNTLTPGSIVSVNGVNKRIFYQGNDGNDVILAPETPATAYVSNTLFAGKVTGDFILDADAGTTGDQSAIFNYNAFVGVNTALSAVTASGTVIVNAGTYAEAVVSAGTKTIEITGPNTPQSVILQSLATAVGQNVIIEGTSTLTVGDATSTTIAGVISGTGSLTKTGTGTVTLSGANTFAGTTTVNVGTLQLGNATALGSTVGTTSVTSGAVLDLNGQTVGAEGLTLNGTGIAAGGALINSNATAASLSGTIAATSYNVGGTGNITLSGSVQGTLTKVAGNTLTLSGVADNGGLVVAANGGTTILAKTSSGGVHAIGSGGTGLTINSGATVQLSGTGGDQIFTQADVVVNAGGILDLNGLSEGFDILSGGGNIRNAGALATLTIGEANAGGVYTGTIGFTGANNIAVTKVGSAPAYFDGSNTYDGLTTVTAGYLVVRNNNALGSTAAGTTVASGATLQLESSGSVNIPAEALTITGTGVSGNRGALATWSGTNSYAGPITMSGDSLIYVNTGSMNLSNVISESGGVRSLTKNGGGLLTLSGANTYTGVTAITAGTVTVSGSLADATDVSVSSGAIYDVAASDTIDGLSGAGSVTLGANTLTVGSNNEATPDFSGVISGTGGFTKIGTGQQSFSGTNLYSGATNINAGVLRFTGVGATSTSSTINVNNTGTLRFGRNDTWGNHTSDVSSPIIVNAGGVVQSGGFYNTLVNLTLNGGTLELTGGAIPAFPAFALKGTVTVGGSQASQINVVSGVNNLINIGDDNLGPTIFTVADSSGNANADLIVNAPLQDNAFGGIGLTKNGAGTMTLSAANTYGGPTSISAGTLLVNGTNSGTGVVNVSNSAVLGGTGSIAGAVNLLGTSRLAPGVAGAESLATGNLTFISTTFFDVQIGGTTAVTQHDQMNVTGAVNLANATLNLQQISGFNVSSGVAQQYIIITNDGSDVVSGTFNGLPEGSPVIYAGGTLYVSYSGNDGNDVVLYSQPTVNGTPNNDTLVLRQVSANPALVEFSLNAAAFVQVTSALPFTFNGLANIDLMLVDTSNGDPISTGNTTFNGELLRVQKNTGLASDVATYVPSTTPNAGLVTLTGFGDINFTQTTNVDFVNLTTVNVQTATIADTLTLLDDNTATNGIAVPAGYSIAAAADLRINGANAIVGLRNVTNANVDTVTGGTNGNDAVTINSGTGAHGITNLTIATGTGTDTVTVTGALTVSGNITINSQNIAVNNTLNGGATSTVSLNAGTGAITTSGTGVDVVAQDLSATATTGINLDTTVLNITATNSGAGNINIDETNGANVLNVAATTGSATVTSTTGNLNVTTVSASTSVTLTATAGAITDANLAAVNITAASATLSATTGIGSGNAIETTLGSLSATNATSGTIEIVETDAITLTSLVQSTDNDANDIFVTAAGTISVGVVNAGTASGDVTLTATTGSIIDDSVDAIADVIGDVVTLTAPAGVGQSGGAGTLDTTANSLDVSVTVAGGSIFITETNAVTLTDIDTADGSITITAGGTITATDVQSLIDSTNVITLTTTVGNILVDLVSAVGDTIVLSAAGAIEEVTPSDAGADLVASVITATAATGIGHAATIEINTITNVSRGLTATVTGTGAIDLLDVTGGLRVLSATTTNGDITIAATTGDIFAESITSTSDVDANDVVVTANAGNIIAGVISAGATAGDVTLTATGGSITDDVSDAAADVIGDLVSMTATSGVGESAGFGSLDTSANFLDVRVTAAGLINLNEINAVTLSDIDTFNGPITINAGGTMTATDVASLLDAELNDITLTTTSGDIAVGTILAGGIGDAFLTAAAAITDIDATNPDITADDVVLIGSTGVATSGDFLEISASNLEAVGGTGGVFVANSGSLIIGNIGSVVGVNASGGNIVVTTTGAMTVAENVTATGATTNVTLTAIDAVAAGQNLVLNASTTVSSAAATVTLNAGDNATINGDITSGGFTTINIDFGDAESAGATVTAGDGGTLTIAVASVIMTPNSTAGGAYLNSGNDYDTFIFNPQETTAFFVDGGAPVGGTTGDILQMNVTDTVNPNLTIPGGPTVFNGKAYNGAGSGVWTFTPDHRNVHFKSIEDAQITGQYHLTYDNSIAPVSTNLVIMLDGTASPNERLQFRDGSTGGTILYQTTLTPILSVRVLGGTGNDTVTVDDINGLPSFAGSVPLSTGVGNHQSTSDTDATTAPEFFFDAGTGTNILNLNLNAASTQQQFAFGTGLAAGSLEAEIQSTNATTGLNAYVRNVGEVNRTGATAPLGGLTVYGTTIANQISISNNTGGETRVAAVGHTSFDFSGNNYNSLVVNPLDGNDTVDLISFGTSQTNNWPITLNGNADIDTIRVRSTSGNTGLINLNGNAGSDFFQLYDGTTTAGTVDNIAGLVIVDGTDGNVALNTDTLTIIDNSDPTADNVLVSPVAAGSSADYAVEGINGLVGNDVVLRNIDTLNYTGTLGNDTIDGQFRNTSPTAHDLSTVSLSGWVGADQFLLFTTDQYGGSGVGFTPTGTPSGVSQVNLFGDASGNPNAVDGNDVFGETPPGITGTGIMQVGLAVSDAVRLIRPSVTTGLAIDGGQPTGPQPPLGDIVNGDKLNLDVTALPNTNPVIVSTFSPGSVVATGIAPTTWTQIEDMNLVDQGRLTNVQMGDLYARTTPNQDLVQFGLNPTPLNPYQVRLRINSTMANYSASNKTIIYSGGHNDTITQANLTIPAEFYGEDGDDNISGAIANDWLVGGIGNDRINAGRGDNVVWGDNAPTLPGDPQPQDGATGGNDILSGLEGADVFYGGAGNDHVSAGDGNDYVNGGLGEDFLDGFGGDDRIYGGAGNDTLTGARGNDLLIGNAGDDKLYGNEGNDVLIGGTEADLLDGGNGNDLLVNGSVLNETSSRTSLATASNYSPATYTNPADNDAALIGLLFQWATASDPTSIAPISHDGANDDLFGGQGDDDFCWEVADVLDNATGISPPDYGAFGMGFDQRINPT